MVKKETTLNKFMNQLEKDAITYEQLMKEFNEYQGVQITPENIEQINAVLLKIQEFYAKNLFPSLSFIVKNHDFAQNIMNTYDKFIANIKEVNETNTDKE